jgi:hypothetical protein
MSGPVLRNRGEGARKMDIDWTLTLIIGGALGALVMIANRVEKIQKDTAAIRFPRRRPRPIRSTPTRSPLRQRGETGAAWEFHGSDGSAGAPWLSIHLCRCGLAFTQFVSG